jgi:RNA polymerase sigma factor (sigma-70 family)
VNDAISGWLEGASRHPLLTHREELELGRMVRAWMDHPGGPDAAPAQVRRRGQRARTRMIAGNLRLVVAVSKRYQPAIRSKGLALEDALQEGVIGLARGVEKYDPARGYKFSTFGYWWIRQGIARWVHTTGLVRTPQHAAERLVKLSVAEIAALPPGERQMLEAAVRAQRVTSLDLVVGDGDGSSLGELQAADDSDALEELHWAQLADDVAERDPGAWALGLEQVERPRGVNRSVVERLRSAA